MHHAIRDDRLWFQGHPNAIVRFRKTVPGEFAALQQYEKDMPSFRPSFSKSNEPLSWVAVVDLMQMMGGQDDSDATAPCARLRLRTTALPSANQHQVAKEELIEALAAEFLAQCDTEYRHSTDSDNSEDAPPELDTNYWLAA